MIKLKGSCIGLALATLYLTAAAPAAERARQPTVDINILHVQLLLDQLGFGPGVIDGKPGQSLTAALKGFQRSRDLPVTGNIDRLTLKALSQYRAIRPLRVVTITPEDAAGPFYGVLPAEPAAQAKLPALGYANLLEKLAERYHTTPKSIVALNDPSTRLAPGARLRVPNALPSSRAYDPKLPDHWRQTLSSLNVSANQPQADHIVVDKSEGTLQVFDKADRLIAQFSATMGSEHDPLPIGTWKIKGAAYDPAFHYNPKLFWDASPNDGKEKLPPGPNSPVGVVWIDISKPHYGIHGTPNPEKIGRTESHGCIRLTNWDAARLSLMVKPGTPAIFQR